MQEVRSKNILSRAADAISTREGLTVAWLVWVAVLVAQCMSVWRHPLERTVTTNYRVAAESFWHQQPMYSEGQHGWLYPPQGAVIYSVFSSIPSVEIGEVLWRLVSTLLFAWSLWELAKLAAGKLGAGNQRLNFWIATACSMALAAGCIRNGQMNLPLAGLFVLACCGLAEKAWWKATLWISLSIAAKPIALPVVLVCGALFPPLWWRLPIGLVTVAAIPFVNPHWGYVCEQYVAALHKMKAAGEPGAGVFSDIVGMLQVFPVVGPGKAAAPVLSESAAMVMRGAMALFTLGISFLALRRLPWMQGCFYLMLFCVAYLMLCNPRTEGNSYVMLAPFVAMLLAWAMQEKSPRMVVLIAAVVILAAAHEFYKDKLDSVWLRPACTIVIGAIAVADVIRRKAPGTVLSEPPSTNVVPG